MNAVAVQEKPDMASVPQVRWKGTYMGRSRAAVERTTPVPAHRTTKSVAMQLLPSSDSVELLLNAAAALEDGEHVLLTAREDRNGGIELVLHAGQPEGEEVI